MVENYNINKIKENMNFLSYQVKLSKILSLYTSLSKLSKWNMIDV